MPIMSCSLLSGIGSIYDTVCHLKIRMNSLPGFQTLGDKDKLLQINGTSSKSNSDLLPNVQKQKCVLENNKKVVLASNLGVYKRMNYDWYLKTWQAKDKLGMQSVRENGIL